MLYRYMSILLELDTARNVTVTLSEKMTVSGAPILFEFYNTTNDTREYCTNVDISTQPQAYNIYRLKAVQSLPDRQNGEFVGLPIATWHYTAYQMTTQGDLNPENAIKILETGICIVNVNPTQRPTFNPDSTTITYEDNNA
jgi:hypothetical protein